MVVKYWSVSLLGNLCIYTRSCRPQLLSDQIDFTTILQSSPPYYQHPPPRRMVSFTSFGVFLLKDSGVNILRSVVPVPCPPCPSCLPRTAIQNANHTLEFNLQRRPDLKQKDRNELVEEDFHLTNRFEIRKDATSTILGTSFRVIPHLWFLCIIFSLCRTQKYAHNNAC